MERAVSVQREVGLSGTALKVIALVTMLLDHIHYFCGYTGLVPEWFSMAGRISGPLFLFCVVEGFTHTRSRKKYFLRIYGIAVGMGLILYLMKAFGLFVRADGFYPANAVMAEFVILMVMWQGMDWIGKKKLLRGICALLLPFLWYFGVVGIFCQLFTPAVPVVAFLSHTVVPTLNMSPDVSIVYLVLGLILYGLRRRRGWQVLAFMAVDFAWFFVVVMRVLSSQPDFSISQMFTTYYEWYGIFAGILMLCYNGQRGAGCKRLFYAFYPAHIYVLYGLSCLAMGFVL